MQVGPGGVVCNTWGRDWEALMNKEILRPGQDWQPCYKEVEEFNPADYRPGQVVDVETARKLHEAGVKLEFSSQEVDWQPNYTAITNSDEWMSRVKAKFRVSMPPGELTADEAKAAFERGEKVQIYIEYTKTWFDNDKSCLPNSFPKDVRYRLKPAPKIRPITNAELPPRFIWQQKDGCAWVINSASIDAEWIKGRVKIGDTWGHDVRGPWREFTVEEKE